MKILLLLLICLSTAFAEKDYSAYSNKEIVDAIYWAEGGKEARVPFGILSVECEGYDACRRICLNSVRNGRRRWEEAGKPDDLIVYIGARYCPPDIHPLNKNWVGNVKYFLENPKRGER